MMFVVVIMVEVGVFVVEEEREEEKKKNRMIPVFSQCEMIAQGILCQHLWLEDHLISFPSWVKSR